MNGYPTEPTVVTLEPVRVAVVRDTVAMTDLPDFFNAAFHSVMSAAQARQVAVTGPPLAIYHGMPTDTVDVSAGFPVSDEITSEAADQEVTMASLPAGRAVIMVHRGPYDSLNLAYDRLMAWFDAHGHRPGRQMWESYLNNPSAEAPQDTETLITWPLDD